MNILEEFWYGNIEPAEYDTSPDKEYKEMLQLISKNEDKLLATMTDVQKELFSRYANCGTIIEGPCIPMNFSNGSQTSIFNKTQREKSWLL